MRLSMGLCVAALAVPAFVQPASARAHSHHHYSGAFHSHRHLAWSGERYRIDGPRRAWRHHGEMTYADAHASFGHEGFGDAQFNDRRFGRERFGRSVATRDAGHGELDAMIARQAQANGVPEALVHRVVIRESRYNPRAVGSGGAMGLMQIKYSTARAMGYTGSPSGLLDAETNLTYAVRYLAGAYKAAGGNPSGAVSNYARGYYVAAKRQGFSPYEGGELAGSYASARVGEPARGRRGESRRGSQRWY